MSSTAKQQNRLCQKSHELLDPDLDVKRPAGLATILAYQNNLKIQQEDSQES